MSNKPCVFRLSFFVFNILCLKHSIFEVLLASIRLIISIFIKRQKNCVIEEYLSCPNFFQAAFELILYLS